MRLEVNGVQYENFTSAIATLRVDALSNTFSFEAVATEGDPLPFRGGEPCRVIVDDIPVLSGYIEIVNVDYDAQGHTIGVSGRDKTGDLLDSSIDQLSDIRSPVTLKAVIEKVLENLNINIDVVDNAGSPAFGAAEYIAAPEPGDNAFDFLERLARHRQVLLSSDSDGNVVIEKTPGPISSGILKNVVGGNDNNILRGSASYDTTGRFNVYKFVSSLNPVAINNAGDTQTEAIVAQEGAIVDTDVRAGRQLVFISELSLSNEEDEARAKWEANVRKTRGRTYSCTVQGFKPASSDSLWLPNTLVSVIDDFAGISATMLINSVTYNFDLDEGSTTTLVLVDQNAYSLSLSEPRSSVIGNGLI